MNANALPEGCSTAVAALARLTLADPSYSKAGESEMLVLPLDADYIACALDPKAGKTSSERKVRPKRTHYVQPAYPFLMQMNRIQGVAMLDSTVTSTGCVTNIRVVRSIQPALDYAAVRAVSGWRFQPATIEGRETAISMILSVNFTLR
jgi:TonB family protein